MDNCLQLQRRIDKLWRQMTGADQSAAEYAIDYISISDDPEYLANATDNELWDATSYGCDMIAEGNAEPEYAGEDFYQEEPDFDTVLRYLEAKRDLAQCQNGGINASTKITASSDVDKMEDTILNYIGSEVLLQELVKSLDNDTKRELYNYIADMYDIPLD